MATVTEELIGFCRAARIISDRTGQKVTDATLRHWFRHNKRRRPPVRPRRVIVKQKIMLLRAADLDVIVDWLSSPSLQARPERSRRGRGQGLGK